MCYPIGEDKLLMKLSSDKMELRFPVFVGWFFLGSSKLHMYDLNCYALKENYRIYVFVVYMDTNSFSLYFKNVDKYKEMQNGAPIIITWISLTSLPTDRYIVRKTKISLVC